MKNKLSNGKFKNQQKKTENLIHTYKLVQKKRLNKKKYLKIIERIFRIHSKIIFIPKSIETKWCVE